MIANTTAAIEKITGQLKTLNTFRKFMTLLLYSAYLIYRIIAGNGYLALNVTLLALTCLYAAFFVYFISVDKNSANKKTYGVVKRVYRWSKLLLTGIGIGLNVSGFLTVAGEGLTLPNLLFAILMPAFFVLQIVFDVLFEYANYCFGLLKKGVEKDIEKVKETYQKPLKVVENVRTTMDGLKNVKEGMAGITSAILQKSKEKMADRRAKREEKKAKKAIEEEIAAPAVAATEAPLVIDVEAHDALPPSEDENQK